MKKKNIYIYIYIYILWNLTKRCCTTFKVPMGGSECIVYRSNAVEGKFLQIGHLFLL